MFEIGNTLREARVRRNLTLQQVEEDIKIRVKYVQAMENEDWDVMPGVTYVKGFLRTYSTYLGLDPDVIIGEFRSRGMTPSAEHHEPFGGSSVIGKPHSHRGRNTIVIVAIVCLIALAAIYALGLLNGDGGNDEPTTKPGALGIGSPSPKASKSPKPTASWDRRSRVAEEPRQGLGRRRRLLDGSQARRQRRHRPVLRARSRKATPGSSRARTSG